MLFEIVVFDREGYGETVCLSSSGKQLKEAIIALRKSFKGGFAIDASGVEIYLITQNFERISLIYSENSFYFRCLATDTIFEVINGKIEKLRSQLLELKMK